MTQFDNNEKILVNYELDSKLIHMFDTINHQTKHFSASTTSDRSTFSLNG